MSYSQIFRRVRRLLKVSAQGAFDRLTKEEKDLFDFDEELRRHAQQARAQSGRAREQHKQQTSQQRAEETRRSSSRQSDGGAQSAKQPGKRKPGEQDDAFYLQKLGLTAAATNEEIKKTYRRLLSKYHPDRVATLDSAEQKRATEKAMEINEAYQILARRRDIR